MKLRTRNPKMAATENKLLVRKRGVKRRRAPTTIEEIMTISSSPLQ